MVRIPTTGEDWELYTSSMACGRAARALTAALKRALLVVDKAIKAGTGHTDDGLETLMDQHLYPVMSTYSSYGAYDTEPRYHAIHALRQASK